MKRPLPVGNRLEGDPTQIHAWKKALVEVAPEVFGKGRYLDNIFVERLRLSMKHEEVYLKAYRNSSEARTGIGAYLDSYNQLRPHQSLGYRTPSQVFRR